MTSENRFSVPRPAIGRWYRRANGQLFEVVAVDEDDATVELQFFDGTIDEVDLETWDNLRIIRVAAPEDWSGSVDMDPEDFNGKDDGQLPGGYQNPFRFLDDRE
jgi:hypothetical protein